MLVNIFSLRLRADKTAAGTGEGLVDLTIGGLWWLQESMVTLGGIVELVTLLTTHSPPTYPQETPVIQAISALHDVFSTLHVCALCCHAHFFICCLSVLPIGFQFAHRQFLCSLYKN